MRELSGRRVLVTGAARGIGHQIALQFARRGAMVLLTDLREELLGEAAAPIEAAGGQARSYRLDVTQPGAIADVRERIHADVGPIDVLVNNAGVVFGGAFLEVPIEQHLLTYQVNTLGVVAMAHAFLPDLIERKGSLVNLASASGFVGLPFGGTYASSKWAVIGFSESLRLELAELGHAGVGVTTVCPSYVDTGMFAGVKPPRSTRLLKPERLAQRIVDAVERDKPYVLAPWIVHLTPVLKGVLPRRWFDLSCRFFGIHDSMRPWRGHVADKSAKPPQPISSR